VPSPTVSLERPIHGFETPSSIAPAAVGMRRSVLIVDDDASVCNALRRVFRTRDLDIAVANDAVSCLEQYERARPDVVLLDHGLPGLSGLQLLGVLRERDPEATVVMLTGHAEIPIAVEAMRLGAENFLTKPVDPAQLDAALARAFEKAESRRQSRFDREGRQAAVHAEDADDAAIQVAGLPALPRQIDLLASRTAPVLLTGETGTGKGWLARLLHAKSPRARAPFVEVGCAGLTTANLDAELFGHETGVLTDAKAPQPGLLEAANGGTLFLDEIGDLAPEVQPKLLKALESQHFRRLGGTREIAVDVRFVAATRHDLGAAVRAGRFRDDLYYRLAVFPVHLPALRERGRGAVLALSTYLLTDLRNRLGRGPTAFGTEALACLLEHAWPGNVRELRNTIERAHLLARDERTISVEHLPPGLHASTGTSRSPSAPEPADDDLSLERAERRHIARVLEHVGGNRVHAARALGIARATLYKKLSEG
jgi:two-component system response regulator HydG